MHGDDLERETGMKMGMGGMRMVVSKKKDGYGDGWHDGWVWVVGKMGMGGECVYACMRVGGMEKWEEWKRVARETGNGFIFLYMGGMGDEIWVWRW